MKVTFILPGFPRKPVGGFRVVYEYANHLAARGHDVYIVHHWAHSKPATVFHSLGSFTTYVKDVLRIRHAIKKWQPLSRQVKVLCVHDITTRSVPDGDAVFATAWQTAESVMQLPGRKGKKFYMVMDFGDYFGPQEELKKTWKFPLKKIAISRWIFNNVAVIAGTENLTYIPLGINHKIFHIKNNTDNRPYHLAMMYAPGYYKAAEDGIAAMEICKIRYPDLKAVVFGNTGSSSRNSQWINYEYRVSNRELVQIYNSSRIFISSSIGEGFAFPSAEAMACGCAVASTDCGGNRDYAEDGVTALLSPPNNPKALADNVLKLLNNEGLRKRISIAGFERIQEFKWYRSAELLENVLLERTRA